MIERYRLLRDLRSRPSSLSFAAADLHELAPRRLTRVVETEGRSEPKIAAEWERRRGIDDPHVERFVEVTGSAEEGLFAVTDAPDAVALPSLLKEGAIPPLAEARRLLAGVSRGLAALHEAGAHFSGLALDDVVLVDDTPARPVIVNTCDAIAQRIAAADTQKLKSVGRLTSFAPEALRRSTDPRSDLYDLGGIAYRLLGGREPFEGMSSVALYQAHLLQTPPRLTHLPRDLAPTSSPRSWRRTPRAVPSALRWLPGRSRCETNPRACKLRSGGTNQRPGV